MILDLSFLRKEGRRDVILQMICRKLRNGCARNLFCRAILLFLLLVCAASQIIIKAGNPHAAVKTEEDLELKVRSVINLYRPDDSYGKIKIRSPLNNSLFPLDMASPLFEWDEMEDSVAQWLLIVRLEDQPALYFTSSQPYWDPKRDVWEKIKRNSTHHPAEITILGLRRNPQTEVISAGTVKIYTSNDAVGAPIMFRRVPPSFSYASLHPDLLEWCLGDISSYERPTVIMSKQPFCSSCHTFSMDGKFIGMDIDYGGDKGAYLLTPLRENILLTRQDLFSWGDFPRNDGLAASGIFSRLSPNGDYVVSTVNDISFLAKISDPYCSQLFFPIQSNLAYYDKSDRMIRRLVTGDLRREIVETDPSWSPDGKYLLFSRTTMTRDLFRELGGDTIFSVEDTDIDRLNNKYPVQFDIYRVPFSRGRGGSARALPGASHNGRSNYFGRYSPDGKWIVFTQSDSGLVLQPDSRLRIMPSDGSISRPMQCNRSRLNSWHTWSPNSRWLAFVSKENMPYTELYLTHIDEDGNDSVPVRVSRFNKPGFAINVPEFANIKAGGIQKIQIIQE